MRYRIGIVSVPEKISNIGIVSDISDISAGRKIRIAAVALYGAEVAAVALLSPWDGLGHGRSGSPLDSGRCATHCVFLTMVCIVWSPALGLFIPLH